MALPENFLKLVNDRSKFRWYMLTQLPVAFFSGIRVCGASAEKVTVSVRFIWITKNPFHSIYFASLAMAAELSTGILAMNAIWKERDSVSMQVKGMSASFTKKAKGRVHFICDDGARIMETAEGAINTNESKSTEAVAVGYDEVGDEVALFRFTWTFKLNG